MAKLKMAYFGTPIFSATLLEKLLNEKNLSVTIDLVITQPDKPVGKKGIITPSPVKVIAQKYSIPVWDQNIKSKDTGIFATQSRAVDLTYVSEHECGNKNDGIELLQKLKQVDLAFVFAFGFKQLIPLDLLQAPKIQFKIGEGKTSGFINIHPSLLPRYRGSSPIAYPILLSENKTGVSLFVMDEKMDHGPIIVQEETEIRLNDVRPDMEKKLADLSFGMVKKLLTQLTNDQRLTTIDQNHTLATHSPFMIKNDGFIPFSILQKAQKNEALTLQELPHIIRNYLTRHPGVGRDPIYNFHSKDDVLGLDSRLRGNDIIGTVQNSALIIFNFWRGMLPWPGVWTKVTINNEEKRLKITDLKYEDKKLVITKVQLEGKNEVDFPTFNKAYQIFI